MCMTRDPMNHVCIRRCCHGANYVTIGPVTLQLTDAELVLLDRAIHKLAGRQPVLHQTLYPARVDHNAPEREEL